MIRVAGVNVPRVAMAEFAMRLRDAGENMLADRILATLNGGDERLSLSLDERRRLAVALHDPPRELAELYSTLVDEHAA